MSYIEELRELSASGALGQVNDLAKKGRGYRSGQPTDLPTVKIKRSSGRLDEGVIVGLDHGGLSTMVQLRHETGWKLVGTKSLVELNPWLANPIGSTQQ